MTKAETKRAAGAALGQAWGPDEVAGFLNISRESAIKAFRKGTIHAVRVGSLWRTTYGDVLRFQAGVDKQTAII